MVDSQPDDGFGVISGPTDVSWWASPTGRDVVAVGGGSSAAAIMVVVVGAALGAGWLTIVGPLLAVAGWGAVAVRASRRRLDAQWAQTRTDYEWFRAMRESVFVDEDDPSLPPSQVAVDAGEGRALAR
jgi:hypothetical protein